MSFSPSLRITLINTGDQAGAWGNTTNTNLGTLIETAIAGYDVVSVISANQALTALNGAADQSRNMVIELTTTTGAPFNVYAPPAEKIYVIKNNSSFAATIFNSTVIGNTTAAGTGVVVPANKTVTIVSNGTNFSFQNDHLSSLTLATDLAVADGGTGASSFTSGGLLRGNGTSAVSVASAADIVAQIGSTTVINAVNATQLTTARLIGGVSFNGTADINLPGVNITGNQSTTGNAFTATALQTARTIGGVSFNGTANINLPGVNTFGNQDTSGNAATATLATNATNATNAATATNPQSGGTFITSSNIASQSVNFANSATNATNAINATAAGTAASCSGNAATATSPQSGGTFITSSNIGSQSVNFATSATNAINATAAGTAASCSGNAATATALQTARTIGGVPFNGTANINLPGVNVTGNQSTTGNAATASLATLAINATNATNAATATALQTARTIGGVSFNGTANINLPGVNTSGNQNTTGNAATATQLTTASGSAASFSARAFVAFNPSASVQFANGGVSSINNLAGQVFQINFLTNMPDTNYTIVCTSSVCFDPATFSNQGVMMQTHTNSTRLVSSCQIRAVKDEFANPSSSAPEYIGVAIFR